MQISAFFTIKGVQSIALLVLVMFQINVHLVMGIIRMWNNLEIAFSSKENQAYGAKHS